MLTLLIGDLFIPDRVVDMPVKFRKLLSPNAPAVPLNAKISQVLCLGNITQSASTLRFLHELSPFFSVVRGEFDDVNLVSQQLALLDGKSDLLVPFYKVVSADNFRIGLTAGYQIVPRNDPLLLLAFAREIDVDILVWGGTHRVEAYTLDGKFFINPGSATGAFSMNWPDIDEDEDEDEDDDEAKGDANSDESESNTNTDSVPGAESKVDETVEETKGDKTKDTNKDEGSGSDVVAETDKEADEEFDSSHLSSTLPSFCLLDTNTSRCTLYIYTHVNGEVKVDKVLYLKE